MKFINPFRKPQPLFFVHIPKTAGTSFRRAAEELYKPRFIASDYGLRSSHTSELVKRHVYGPESDYWTFFRECRSSGIRLYTGHVNVTRFMRGVGVDRTITFVRDPIARLFSEYRHFVRHNDYKGSFPDFYRQEGMQNRQAKILHGVPLAALGFVGITERYAEGLELINNTYQLRLPVKKENTGDSGVGPEDTLTHAELAELRDLNAEDIRVYEQAKALFEERWAMYKKGLEFAHADLVKVEGNIIRGWAWWAGTRLDPVDVEVLVNDRSQARSRAVDYQPGLCRFQPPRGGYVGFQSHVSATRGDRVQCRIPSTGQLFPVNPIVIA